jgi:phage-related minor tail protein
MSEEKKLVANVPMPGVTDAAKEAFQALTPAFSALSECLTRLTAAHAAALNVEGEAGEILRKHLGDWIRAI